MFHHRNKKYSIRKVKNGVASVVIALLFATNSSPALAAVGDTYPSAGCFGSFFGGTKNDCEPLRGEQGELPGERGEAGPPAPPELGGRTQGPLKGEEGERGPITPELGGRTQGPLKGEEGERGPITPELGGRTQGPL
ncbi:YSIRK-type signal peptide-containing protein, partial [Streptococcus ruminantium]